MPFPSKGIAQVEKKAAILLVHGLSGAHTKWNDLISFLPADIYAYQKNYFIGSGSYGQDNHISDSVRLEGFVKTSLIPEDERYLVYTMSFKNNQGLSFDVQGMGVRNVVDRIKNTSGRDVILVGHSMGGLACRACIKQDPSYIAGLVTAATPHVGSYLGLINDYYEENKDKLTPAQFNKYNDLALSVKNSPNAPMIGKNQIIRLFVAWDARKYSDGSSFLDRIQDAQQAQEATNAILFDQLVFQLQALSLGSAAVAYLIPHSHEMQDLYKQNLPPDLPVGIVLSKLDITSSSLNEKTSSDPLEFIYMMAPGLALSKAAEDLSKELIGKGPAAVAGMLEQSLKALYLEKGEDLYPPNGDYLNYTDGVVTVFSQDIRNGISNAEEIENIGIFGTNRFHNNVPNDVITMDKAISFVLNAGNKTNSIKVGLILDSSGSMRDSDPGDIRKEASESIIEILQPQDEIFIVDFDNNARFLNQNETRKGESSDLKRYIRQIDSNGGTNIGLGLSTMQGALLEGVETNFKSTGILLLTDGQGNYNREADWYSMNGIPIYTISYKQFADANLMNSIASQTKGNYYRVNSAEQILQYFMQFYYGVSGNSTLLRKRVISGSYSSDPIYIDPSAEELVIYLQDLNSGTSNVGFIDPNNRRFTLANASQLVRGNNFMFARFRIKVPGLYNFFVLPQTAYNHSPSWPPDERIISGPSSRVEEELPLNDFTIEVSTNTKIKVAMDIKENAIGYYTVSFSGDEEMVHFDQSAAELLVTSPSGNRSTYKRGYKDGTISFVPLEGKGNYQVDAWFKGTDKAGKQINRHYLRSVLIGNVQPGYMGEIELIMGNYIYTSQGVITRNKPGITVEVYKKGSSFKNSLASGYVTEVTDKGCTIELQQINGDISEGDVVILNILQWKAD